MGIYYTTVIVHGFHIKDRSTIEPQSLELMQKNYKDHYIFDNKGVLVFVPVSKYNVDAIDPIIEKKKNCKLDTLNYLN